MEKKRLAAELIWKQLMVFRSNARAYEERNGRASFRLTRAIKYTEETLAMVDAANSDSSLLDLLEERTAVFQFSTLLRAYRAEIATELALIDTLSHDLFLDADQGD